MIYISSDTNVWIDFVTIDQIELPFRLPYTYIMSRDAVEDELISPPGLSDKLISCGLVPIELTTDDFYLAEEYGTLYKRLSVYDRIALAIAKNRNITLLTGDGSLRKAAQKENVAVTGTLGILDQLMVQHRISPEEYILCLKSLLANNGRAVRLPEEEIQARIRKQTKP